EMEEELRAPDEHDHRDPKRDDRPEELERDRAVDGVADLIVVCAVELRREDGEKDRDERREERGDGDQEEIDGVDLRGLLGRLLRKERKIREHRSDTVRVPGLEAPVAVGPGALALSAEADAEECQERR